jgi:hypothetical protein
MSTLSISRWTNWSDVVAAAEQAGGDANKHCSWIGKDPENEDNAILIYDEVVLDSLTFEQAFLNQNTSEIKKAADLKNIQGVRKNKYPSIGDQLDMLWHAIDSGSLDKDSDFYTTLKAVKDANPKA